MTQSSAPAEESQDEPSEQEEDVSQILSQRMLQGWALLETCCPRSVSAILSFVAHVNPCAPNSCRCSTPLVRNKEKRMSCVKCKAWVMTEKEASQVAPNTSRGPSGPSAATALDSLSKGLDSGTVSIAPPSPLPSSLSGLGFDIGNKSSDLGPTSLLPTDLVIALKETLLGKLWEAQKSLATASVGTGENGGSHGNGEPEKIGRAHV